LKNKLKLRKVGFLWDLEKPLPKLRPENKVTMRAATAKDRERLGEIVVEAYLPEWSWWVRKVGGKNRARDDLMSYVTEFLRDREKRIFIAEEDEKIVGFSGAAKYNRATGTVGYGIAVLPGFRKRGIGTNLLLVSLYWLKKSKVRFVTLEEETFGFANSLTPAMILYRRLGGEIISDKPETS
jgi:ribosomal protein S18 acetylase RimI-like enzyme